MQSPHISYKRYNKLMDDYVLMMESGFIANKPIKYVADAYYSAGLRAVMRDYEANQIANIKAGKDLELVDELAAFIHYYFTQCTFNTVIAHVATEWPAEIHVLKPLKGLRRLRKSYINKQ